MRVIRAETLGFCEGVRRAVDMAWQASEQAEPLAGVYTLGPLIHNSRVLESLEGRGVICLSDNELPPLPDNSTVIIRAHGISPLLQKALVRPALTLLDATCPHVKKSQCKARSFAEKGYRVFLAGEENHGELVAIRGYVEAAGAECYVAGNPAEAENAARKLAYAVKRAGAEVKTALIAQTTINGEEYNAIGKAIRRFFPGLEMAQTICGATAERQDSLRELCGKVDALVIVGSRESANTRRLLSLALEKGKPAWLAETPGDLPPEIMAYKTVGLSAGASTPDSLIEEIEGALLGI